MKNIYKISVISLIALLLVACGNGDSPEQKSADDVSASSPYSVGLNDYYEELKEETDGEINVKHHPDGQLGDKDEIVEGVESGTLKFGMVGGFPNSSTAETMMLPYLFKDDDHQDKVMNGETGEKIIEKIEEEIDVKIVGHVYFAPRQLTTKNTEVQEPEDLKGLKIRVPDNDISIATWKALGASPSPIAFTEVFSGLQQGVINGQENPYDIIKSSSFDEVQDMLIETNHALPVRWFIMNDDYYDSLSDEQQIMVEEKWAKYSESIEEQYKSQLDEAKEELIDEGMQFIEPDEKAFRKATEDVLEDIGKERLGEELFKEIQDLK